MLLFNSLKQQAHTTKFINLSCKWWKDRSQNSGVRYITTTVSINSSRSTYLEENVKRSQRVKFYLDLFKRTSHWWKAVDSKKINSRLSQLFTWFFNGYLSPLITSFIHVTAHTDYGKQAFCSWKDVWRALIYKNSNEQITFERVR